MKKIVKAKKYKDKLEIKKFFNENGWIAIKSEISKKEIKLIQSDFDKLTSKFIKMNFNAGVKKLDKIDKKKLFSLQRCLEKSLSLSLLSNTFLPRVQNLNNSNSPVFCLDQSILLGIPKDTRLVYNYHQESNFMKGFEDIINVHYPIFYNTNLKNGTMSALSKTHKLGNLKYNKKRKANNSYTDLVPENISKLKKHYEEIYFELELGDVLYFHKDLIHKSNYNMSSNTRPVGIFSLTQSIEKGEIGRQNPSDL